jgi:hypothetical protein
LLVFSRQSPEEHIETSEVAWFRISDGFIVKNCNEKNYGFSCSLMPFFREINMEKPKLTLNQTLTSAFLVVGAIVISAVAFNYSGKIQLKFGADGMQVQVDGTKEASP